MAAEHNRAQGFSGAGARTEQLYAQLLRLNAGMEEVKNAVRAIRRRLDALQSPTAAENKGEKNE